MSENESKIEQVQEIAGPEAEGKRSVTQGASPDARRRFIKAGVIGAPVLLTLKGRTAWAASGNSGNS